MPELFDAESALQAYHELGLNIKNLDEKFKK